MDKTEKLKHISSVIKKDLEQAAKDGERRHQLDRDPGCSALRSKRDRRLDRANDPDEHVGRGRRGERDAHGDVGTDPEPGGASRTRRYPHGGPRRLATQHVNFPLTNETLSW